MADVLLQSHSLSGRVPETGTPVQIQFANNPAPDVSWSDRKTRETAYDWKTEENLIFAYQDQEKLREHMAYLKRVSTSGTNPPITHETAELSRRAWWEIWMVVGSSLPIPAACTGPEGQMFYAWDRGRHHLELEIIPGQPAEFFYQDRVTGGFWEEDHEIGKPLPMNVIEAFKLVVEHQ